MVAVTSSAALVGSGGFGKSVTAVMACHDPTVLEHFTAGIAWITCGQGVNVDGKRLELLNKLLTGEDSKLKGIFDRARDVAKAAQKPEGTLDMETIKGAIESELSNARWLVVLDDIWEDDVVQQVLPSRMCMLSRVLITTARPMCYQRTAPQWILPS